jgi:hypothetical protein
MRLARNTIVPDDEPESSPSSLPPLSLGRNLKVRPEAEEAARALDDDETAKRRLHRLMTHKQGSSASSFHGESGGNEPMLPELLDLTSRTRYKEQFALLDANNDGWRI